MKFKYFSILILLLIVFFSVSIVSACLEHVDEGSCLSSASTYDSHAVGPQEEFAPLSISYTESSSWSFEYDNNTGWNGEGSFSSYDSSLWSGIYPVSCFSSYHRKIVCINSSYVGRDVNKDICTETWNISTNCSGGYNIFDEDIEQIIYEPDRRFYQCHTPETYCSQFGGCTSSYINNSKYFCGGKSSIIDYQSGMSCSFTYPPGPYSENSRGEKTRETSCAANFKTSGDYGLCCNTDSCDLTTKDYTCDFDAYIPGKDACNNIDTNSNGYKDACCPASLGAAEKYIVNEGELVERPLTEDEIKLCAIFNEYGCKNEPWAIENCFWDGEICKRNPEYICNDTGVDKCVECTDSTAERDCGEGQACCDGKCYNPASEVCCGMTGGSSYSWDFVDCREKKNRSEWCVESGGVCYKAGENTKCMKNNDVEEINRGLEPKFMYEPLVSDKEWTIVGHLRRDINEQIDSISLRGVPYLGYVVPDPLISTGVVSDSLSYFSPGDLRLEWTVSDNLKVSVGLAAMYDVRTSFRKVLVGFKKVLQEGRGGGRGSGRVEPERWTYIPIYVDVEECKTEIVPAQIAGVEYWFDKNYKLKVDVMSDFKKTLASVGVVFSKKNMEIGSYYIESSGDPTCFYQDGGVFFGITWRF